MDYTESESPIRRRWHRVTGVIVLALASVATVVVVQWFGGA